MTTMMCLNPDYYLRREAIFFKGKSFESLFFWGFRMCFLMLIVWCGGCTEHEPCTPMSWAAISRPSRRDVVGEE